MENSQIEQIEKQIEGAKEFVQFAEAIERLKSNRDFQAVVMKGYFEREAIRLVNAKADVNCQSADSQRSIVQQIDAIGCLHAFLNGALRRGEIGRAQVAEGEEALAEIHAEEAGKGAQ